MMATVWILTLGDSEPLGNMGRAFVGVFGQRPTLKQIEDAAKGHIALRDDEEWLREFCTHVQNGGGEREGDLFCLYLDEVEPK